MIDDIVVTTTNMTDVRESTYIDQLTLKSPDEIQLNINLLLKYS
jgi:hypothetical protein